MRRRIGTGAVIVTLLLAASGCVYQGELTLLHRTLKIDSEHYSSNTAIVVTERYLTFATPDYKGSSDERPTSAAFYIGDMTEVEVTAGRVSPSQFRWATDASCADVPQGVQPVQYEMFDDRGAVIQQDEITVLFDTCT